MPHSQSFSKSSDENLGTEHGRFWAGANARSGAKTPSLSAARGEDRCSEAQFVLFDFSFCSALFSLRQTTPQNWKVAYLAFESGSMFARAVYLKGSRDQTSLVIAC